MLDTAPKHGRYTLRPIVEDDYDFLWNLKIVTLRGYIEEYFGWDDETSRSFLRRTMENGHLVLVDGQPAGILKVYEEGGWLYLAEIGLMPEYQNKGLGTQMIQDVLDLADKLGINVELQVFANNPARRLYERMGFQTTHHKMYRPVGLRR